MLRYRLLRNHAGIMLIGDYTSLRMLHSTVHTVNEKASIIDNKEGTFLGLAYDVRKAYEGAREVIKQSEDEKAVGLPDYGVQYGVEILWPVILVQSRILREGLSFFNSTKVHQGMTFCLEAIIEDALVDDFGYETGHLLIEYWERLHGAAQRILEEKLDSRGAQFCLWKKKQRMDMLVGLIASFDPLYPLLYKQWTNRERNEQWPANHPFAAKNLVAPEALDALKDTEWVDPKC